MATLHAQRLLTRAAEKGDHTPTAIARRIKVRRSTVTRLLAGETVPSLPSLLAMRTAYGLSLDDLVNEAGEAAATEQQADAR